ncbi:MAG: response regulator [Candidatus Methylacidiphilales bacterium]
MQKIFPLLIPLPAVLVVILGLSVIAGWHFQIPALVQFRPGYASMQYLAALCFVFCGVALLLEQKKRFRIAGMLCAALAAMLSLVLCAEYIAGIDVGLGSVLKILPTLPGQNVARPSPPTSVCFLVCGLLLMIAGSSLKAAVKRPVVLLGGSFVIALCVMAVSGYITGLTGTYAWGRFDGMAIHTALGMIVLASGVMMTLLTNPELRLRQDPWLPAAVVLATVTATLVLWLALMADQQKAAAANTHTVAKIVAVDTLERVGFRLRAIKRMAERWNAGNGTSEELWRKDAEHYLRDEKVFTSFQWVDSGLNIRWEAPLATDTTVVGSNLADEKQWDAEKLLRQSLADGTSIISPAIRLKNGRPAFVAYFPISRSSQSDGFIAGVFDMEMFLHDVLSESEGLNHTFSLYDGDKLVFSNHSREGEFLHGLSAESTVNFYGHRWKFVVAPTEGAVPVNNLAYLILWAGFGFSCTLGLAMHSWRTAQHKAQALKQSNADLQSEIAAREKVQEEFRASEERLRLVLESATGISVITTGMDGIITYFSKGSEIIFGYSAKDMVGNMYVTRLHKNGEIESRGRELSRMLGRNIEGFDVFIAIPQREGSESREWTYVHKDGTFRTVHLTVTILHDAGGKIAGYLGTAVDITELKKAEIELRAAVQAESTAHALLKSAGRIARLGHWEMMLDNDGPQWSDVSYAIHEVPVGTKITIADSTSFIQPKDMAHVQESVNRCIATKEPCEFEIQIITGKGNPLWIFVRGEAVVADDGKVIGLRGVCQDVDARHKAEELLTLRNQQLEEATLKAEASAKAKADFLANMSHEIRTPLNAVIGMSDLLQDSTLDRRQKELLETVRTSGDVLLALINEILDFSKIEAGQLEIERIPVDLHECIESALDLVSHQAVRKNLELLYWIDPEVPAHIVGDMSRLRQILVNLISNGVKFTERGEIFIRVSRAISPEGAGLLRFSVRDTGIGIPHDRRHRLFHAFSQVDTSTSRRFGGTGLGLAICHRLTDLMKGRIWVDSQENAGSDFQFEIPLEPAPTAESRDCPQGILPELTGIRALIVDTNKTSRWILESRAAAWGMVCTVSESSPQAARIMDAGSAFDIAIINGNIEQAGRSQIVSKLHASVSGPTIPMLLIATPAERGDESLCSDAQLYLGKPVKTQALWDALLGALHRKQPLLRVPSSPSGNLLAQECPLKILVADDMPINQRVIALMLEKLGYRAELVANGLEVLDALTRKRFDVLLLDVQMPEMDGLEAARAICKNYARGERPRIVALTADAGDGDRELCLSAGMDDYISKPVRSNVIAQALRTAYLARYASQLDMAH